MGILLPFLNTKKPAYTNDAPVTAAPYFPTDLASWASILGIDVGDFLHAVMYGGGSLASYVDLVGNADIDTVGANLPDYQGDWSPGRGGGFALDVALDLTTQVSCGETNPWDVGTGTWTLHWTYKRTPADSSASNRALGGTGQNGQGIKMIERNNDTPHNWIFGSAEDQGNVTSNCIIQDGPLPDKIVDVTFSRVSTTLLELWASEEGEGDVYHEDAACDESDNFSSSTVLEILSMSTLGRAMQNSQFRAHILHDQIGTADMHDLYRGTTRTGITEA